MSAEKSNVVTLKPKAATDRQVAEALASSSRTATKHEQLVREAYKAYVANGWKPILLYKGRKRPVGNNWLENPTHPIEDFTGHHNIGIALGDYSDSGNPLADLDLDHPRLIEAAPVFLPPTPAKFGRYYGQSKQSLGHWLYRVKTEKTYKLSAPVGLNSKSVVVAEIRGTGGQTVFPPSFVYDDDLRDLDLVCWDGGPKASPPKVEDIPEVSLDYLRACKNLLTASVFVADHLEKGGFHDGMLSWAGMLAKAGYSKEDTIKSVLWIAEQTGQEGVADRLKGVESSYDKVIAGEEVHEDGTNRVLGISWFKQAIPDEKFTQWLGVLFKIKSQLEDDGRPIVRVVASKETQLLDDTLAAMIHTKKFYSLAGQIVVINKELSYIHKDTGEITFTARMTSLSDSVSMQSWLSREIQFVQSVLDKVAMQYTDQVIRAPTGVSTELANINTYRGNMCQITGLSNIPTITRRGRIIDDSWGYDSELKLFFACRFPVRRIHPDEAIKVLREPFVDFPFTAGAGEEDSSCEFGERFGRYHAAAVSAIIAAVVRPAVSICPMYVITSSQYNDGKSVMSNAIAASVGMEGGSPNSPLTRGGSDEEQEKQISSTLARGKRVIVYDNHDGEFRSAALTETLTSENPEFRVLGKSEVRTVPNRSMFVLNGVNTVLASDLQTRSIIIRMERRDIDPQRNFKHLDVVSWCGDNSERLVCAAISLVEWALSQDNGDWRATHRFKDWDYLVRRTVMLACGVDISPPLSEDNDRAMDPIEEIKNQFLPWVLSKWDAGVRADGKKNFFRAKTLAEEVRPMSDEEGWVDVLSRRPNQPMDQKMGRCLAAVCGVPFEYDGGVFTLKRYIVEKTSAYKVEILGKKSGGGSK